MRDTHSKGNMISAAEKTLDLIEILAEGNGKLTVSGIAKKLNMHVSSVDRYILTLCAKGYAEKDPATGMFKLSDELIRLSSALVEKHPLTERYLDVMHTLSYVYNTTTHIMAFHNHETITLHKDLRTRNMAFNNAFFDKTRYYYCSAPGKMLLSTFTDQELSDYLDHSRIVVFNKKTLASKEAIYEEIMKVRKQGYSIHDEEWLTGSFAISFPLTVNGSIQGTMTLMTDIDRADEFLAESTINHVKLLCREPTVVQPMNRT